MYARSARFKFHEDSIDAGIQILNDTLPELRRQRGFRDAYLMADRSTGESMTLTVWATEDAVRASFGFAQQAFAKISGMIQAEPEVHTYEVVGHESAISV